MPRQGVDRTGWFRWLSLARLVPTDEPLVDPDRVELVALVDDWSHTSEPIAWSMGSCNSAEGAPAAGIHAGVFLRPIRRPVWLWGMAGSVASLASIKPVGATGSAVFTPGAAINRAIDVRSVEQARSATITAANLAAFQSFNVPGNILTWNPFSSVQGSGPNRGYVIPVGFEFTVFNATAAQAIQIELVWREM